MQKINDEQNIKILNKDWSVFFYFHSSVVFFFFFSGQSNPNTVRNIRFRPRIIALLNGYMSFF